MKKALVYKRDSLIVGFLRVHRGKANAVTMQNIADFLKEKGFNIHVRSIDPIVDKITLELNLPVLHCAKGYFWANTQEEVLKNIAEYNNRIATMQTYITHLLKFVMKAGEV